MEFVVKLMAHLTVVGPVDSEGMQLSVLQRLATAP